MSYNKDIFIIILPISFNITQNIKKQLLIYVINQNTSVYDKF